MMGNKQKLKSALEHDVVYARSQYCYLFNNCSLKKYAKRQMAKRRRKESKKIIMENTE